MSTGEAERLVNKLTVFAQSNGRDNLVFCVAVDDYVVQLLFRGNDFEVVRHGYMRLLLALCFGLGLGYRSSNRHICSRIKQFRRALLLSYS